MATIAPVAGNASGATNIVKTALTGTDDLAVKAGFTQLLVLENTGASTPTVNILGDQATTVACNGIGDPIDVSGGFDVVFTASGTDGAVQIIPLSSISAYTNDAGNAPAVTGGTSDIEAYIIER